jgi:hypothetical protein
MINFTDYSEEYFIPTPTEAEYAQNLGMIAIGIVGALFIIVFVTDIPKVYIEAKNRYKQLDLCQRKNKSRKTNIYARRIKYRQKWNKKKPN